MAAGTKCREWLDEPAAPADMMPTKQGIEIVDGYLHCGQRKFRPVEDVREVMQGAGVSRAVLVQHLGEFDNGYIGHIVSEDRGRFAGVFLVDHSSSRSARDVRDLAASGNFAGIRLLAETLTTAPELWHEAFENHLVIVLYAPGGVHTHIDLLESYLDAHPEARVVLTHLGNPDVKNSPRFEEYEPVMGLARFPGIYFQLSGMKMFCAHPHRELYPLIQEATERFGASRLLWGSNYPLVGDLPEYVDDLRLLLEAGLPVPKASVPDVIGINARKLWFPSGD